MELRIENPKPLLRPALFFLCSALLVSTPFALGTVAGWPLALMEACILLMGVLWLLSGSLYGCTRREKTLLVFCGIFLFLGALQILPLPSSWISVLSPGRGELDESLQVFLGRRELSTISVSPCASRKELTRILCLLLFLLILVTTFREAGFFRKIFVLFAWLGSGMAVFALLQSFTWNGMIYWTVPLSRGGVPFGPFVNRNHFAGFMSMIALPVMGMLMASYSRIFPRGCSAFRVRMLRVFGQKEGSLFLLLCFGLSLMILSIVSSHSRAGIAAFLLGASLFIFLCIRSAWKGKTLFPLVLLGILSLALIFWMGQEALIDRFKALGREDHRLSIWKDSFSILKEHPLFGSGLGTYGNLFEKYQTFPLFSNINHAESDWLEFLVEMGIAGFLPIVALGILLAATAISKLRVLKGPGYFYLAGASSGLLALFLHGLFEFNLHINSNALVFLTLVWIVISFPLQEREECSFEECS